MITETITYTTFNDPPQKVTETHHFNLTRTDLIRWEMEKHEGVAEYFLRLSQSNDKTLLGEAFHDFLRRTYGIKSEDGKHHTKSPEISDAFESSAAFDEFYVKLITDQDYAAKFIRGVLPKEWLRDTAVDTVMETPDQRLRAVSNELATMPPPPPGLPQNPAGA